VGLNDGYFCSCGTDGARVRSYFGCFVAFGEGGGWISYSMAWVVYWDGVKGVGICCIQWHALGVCWHLFGWKGGMVWRET